jgi:hypothetical protein
MLCDRNHKKHDVSPAYGVFGEFVGRLLDGRLTGRNPKCEVGYICGFSI